MLDNRPCIDQFIDDKSKTAYLAGIGGVSMLSLAEVLLSLGINITGSDSKESEGVLNLISRGIKVNIGHSAENTDNVDYIIRTAAIHDDNPEIANALQKGIPVYERAEAWGALMKKYKNAICVSGTHGKTSTTSMITNIALAAESDPTVMVGGSLPIIGGGYRVGNGDTIILESCEYRNSFLYFFPTVAVILNVDADHLDFFKDLDDVSASFRKFAQKVPEENGVIIANADDENTMKCIKGINREIVTFGLENDADVTAKNIVYSRGLPSFEIFFKGQKVGKTKLLVPGHHNILNALAAAAACIVCGFPSGAVLNGLASYSGVGRRFEYKGQCSGAMIYDDYAHHPNEIHALFDAIETMEFDRIICAFQPHTFSRTKSLFDDFVKELSRPDVLVLADIFAARETDDLGMSSSKIAAEIEGAYVIPDFDDMADFLMKIARPGDIIVTVGAGELNKVSEKIAHIDETKKKKRPDPFNHDVAIGGLHNINDVKMLICYLVDKINCPLKRNLIFQSLQTDALASYWNIAQALSELIKSGVLIIDKHTDDEYYVLNESLKDSARMMANSLPFSVKEHAALEATRLVSRARALDQNKIVVEDDGKGGKVLRITVCDGELELLSISLPVSDEFQARALKEKFLEKPTDFYNSVIKLLIG